MCILPSRKEFDDIEARERRIEKALKADLKTAPVEVRTRIEREIEMSLRFSVLRFAGAALVADSH